MKTKRCPKCEETKAVGEFNKNPKIKGGLGNKCEQCRYWDFTNWQKENPEPQGAAQILAYQKQRRKEHSEQVRMHAMRRRSNRYGSLATLILREWQELLIEYNNCCAYCDSPFTEETPPVQDHFIPLSKGGTYTKENIVPACQICNSIKHAKVFNSICEVREYIIKHRI